MRDDETVRKHSERYVTRAECAQISNQIREELKSLKAAVVGENLRGGISKEIHEIKSDLKEIKEYINSEKTKGRDWRMLGFAVLGSITSGTVITVINLIL